MSELTHEQIQSTRTRLNEFCKDNPEFKDRQIAKEIGYSPAYVNQFRNDNFPNKNSEALVAQKVESFLTQQETSSATGASKKDLTFVMTSASKTIFKVADYAKVVGRLGVVTGVPGSGRTITCKEYVRRFPTSILIEVSPLVTKKSLIQEIASALKIATVYYKDSKPYEVSSNELFKEIINQLSGTSRLLIIDEGENLTLSCLEVIRRIQDFTDIGILLSGTSVLLDRLRGTRKELQQLFSRVGIKQQINVLQFDDVRAILHVNYPEAIKFAPTFLSLSKNNGRYLKHLISLVKKTIQETGEPLNGDLIDDAALSLLM